MKKLTMIIVLFVVVVFTGSGAALERGAILYHTSEDGKMYGKTPTPANPELELPCSLTQIVIRREFGSGHVALYIGNERIIHAVRDGVVEDDSRNFIPQSDLDNGYQYVGAKVPANYATWTDTEKDQLILKAREQLGADYDLQFRHQKGPYSDGFTCVGLVEYVYEQSGYNGGAGYNITLDGYYPDNASIRSGKTYVQTYNCAETAYHDDDRTNTFSEDVEFSRFEHPLAATLNVGLLHDENSDGDNERYIFFPYTQYIQTTTTAVTTDVPVSGGSGPDDDKNWWECFIVSAAYGSPLHPHVTTFRSFRDRYLRTSSVGRMIVGTYYKYSPPLARFISKHPWARLAARIVLLPVLAVTYVTLQIGPVLSLAAIVFIPALLFIPVYVYRRRRPA